MNADILGLQRAARARRLQIAVAYALPWLLARVDGTEEDKPA